MMKKIRNFILRNVFKRELITLETFKYAKFSYSQEGEDILLYRLLNKKKKGVYVDVGAHHPIKISNTYFFYKKGWKGVNIDAMPGSMKLFQTIRPHDENIEAAISNTQNNLEFYEFSSPEFNTFSSDLMQKTIQNHSVKLIKQHQLKTQKLSDVLNDVAQKIDLSSIDFLSIDVEGFDLEVLKSNDWNKYRPSFILIEIHNQALTEVANSEIYQHLQMLNYNPVCKTYNTWIFKTNEYRLEL